MTTVNRKLHFQNGTRGRKHIERERPVTQQVESGKIPRISRLMALAIRFERMICEGAVVDQTELARLARVTQPRMTQIMNLLHLAPDIQETLLFLPRVKRGKDPITERDLRPIVAEADWGRQRRIWLSIFPFPLRVNLREHKNY